MRNMAAVLNSGNRDTRLGQPQVVTTQKTSLQRVSSFWVPLQRIYAEMEVINNVISHSRL